MYFFVAVVVAAGFFPFGIELVVHKKQRCWKNKDGGITYVILSTPLHSPPRANQYKVHIK